MQIQLRCSANASTAATNTEGATVEPPPAGGHLPTIANSSLLRTTRDKALHTPGISWVDEEYSSQERDIVSGRDTRKMNLYQAVRDAMRS